MEQDEHGHYKVHVQGHGKEMLFSPGVSACGDILDGVSFRHEKEGGWVIPFEDLESMYILAVTKRREIKKAKQKK